MARKAQSSLENPLRIGEIPVGNSGGMIGITFAPGKQQSTAWSGAHQRDLQVDLDSIAAWKAAVVVTLVETHELATLGIQNLGDETRRRGMEWHHWPIQDYGVPDKNFEAAWPARSEELRALMSRGGRVLIHCKGGLGRAGTIGARLLVETGVAPDFAIKKVREVRGSGAIETKEQERWVAFGRETPRPTGTVRVRDQKHSLDWFQKLAGFKETSYHNTQEQFEISEGKIRSLANGRTYQTGTLELVSLETLRQRVTDVRHKRGRSSFRNIVGDARTLHQQDEFEGALFQVASQFNLLEMVGPNVTPEHGVTRYQNDGTQGPACAIAAGAATIYRNYFVPIDGQRGQTSARQLDGLADVGKALAKQRRIPTESLWTMRNGYALCSVEGLKEIGDHLKKITESDVDYLRSLLRIGLHMDVEVTEGTRETPAIVSQAFCSALPVAYTNVTKSLWRSFAELVLEAAYEATLLAGALNAARGKSNIVLLTQIGGGAFGNDSTWIQTAIKRALTIADDFNLDIRMVNYHSVSSAMANLQPKIP